jgi:alpha-beta hydrolase superfamily lysophospholipase
MVSPVVVADSNDIVRENYNVSVDDTVFVNVQHIYKEEVEMRGAVLMVHGGWHTKFFYHFEDDSKYSIQEYLANKKFDTYALDLRGSGDSYKSDYVWYSQISQEDYVKDIKTIIIYIQSKGYEKIHLISHSLGGMVSCIYTAEYGSDTISSLVLIGTPFSEFNLDPELLEQFRVAAENYPVIPCDPDLVQMMFFAEGKVKDKVLEGATEIISQEVLGSTVVLQSLDLVYAEKVSEIDEDIPVLVLQGGLDAIVTNQDAMNLYLELAGDNNDLRMYGEHGHNILLEKKAKNVYKDIYEFLKSN